MRKNYYIITGTTRGIGESIARQLMSPENVIVCLSRNNNPILSTEAMTKGIELIECAVDLAEPGKIPKAVHNAFRRINDEDVAEITLINNAGTIHPIRKVGGGEASEQIVRAVAVNLTAAMIVTDVFLRETKGWEQPRRIVNLSTGASMRPVEGWSAYCSAKAGLRMFSQCLALEQKSAPNPVKVMAFAPGVVDTEMQSEIRNAKETQFPELDKFKDYKSSGKLLKPRLVAEKLLGLINAPEFGEILEVDVRDHL